MFLKTKFNFTIYVAITTAICFILTFCFSACTPPQANKNDNLSTSTFSNSFNYVIATLDTYFDKLEKGEITNNFEDEDQTECPTCKLKRIRKISTFFVSISQATNLPETTQGIPIKVTLKSNAENHYSFNGKLAFGVENNNFFCTLGFADATAPNADNFQFYRFDIEYNSTTKTFENFVSQFYLSGQESRLNYITNSNGNFSLLSKSSQSYEEKFANYQNNGYNNFESQTTTGTVLDFSQQYKDAFGVE